MTKEKKNKKVSKIEKFLYKSMITLSIFLIVGIVMCQAALARINLEVQKLNDKVTSKKEENMSLVMKINEMACLENIENVSNDMGLAYNNENIKTVE